MRELSYLEQLMDAQGAPLTNWRDIIDEINSEWSRTFKEDIADKSGFRDMLLGVFDSVMTLVQGTIDSDGIEEFVEARRKHYHAFLLEEALVGADVCVETLDIITRREIANGRMSPDNELRNIAEQGMAAPHLSCAELTAKATSAPAGQADKDIKAQALHDLDVPKYFGLNGRETFFYRFLCLVNHRREMKFARMVARELDSANDGPLSDFERGRLLGILDGLFQARAISEHMYCLLQIQIQDRKDWSR